MAGKDNSVQAHIIRKYPKATSVHSAPHSLNLVVNYLNSIVTVRNTCGTIKHRKLSLNVPLLSKTR